MSLENPEAPHVSPFPPIADYGFLSDCETCALIAPSGAIEWMCLPRHDGPSVFGALLDRDAGTFRLGPADTMVPAARRYLPGTMILETSWGTSRGWLIVRDVLLVGPWHDSASLRRRWLAETEVRSRSAAARCQSRCRIWRSLALNFWLLSGPMRSICF
jgi:GH15 family glucan-1,4-alpha-glucosidase